MKYDFSPGELEKCESRIINALGLALKAGKCAVGSEKCVEEIRAENAKLVIVPCDNSENTEKRINDAVTFHNVPLIKLCAEKKELARKFGKKSEVSCAALLDAGFVKIVDKLYGEIHATHTEVQQ